VPVDSIPKAHTWLPDRALAPGAQNCGCERAGGVYAAVARDAKMEIRVGSMKTWATSAKCLGQMRRTRVWATLVTAAVMWGPMAYIAMGFRKVGLGWTGYSNNSLLANLGLLLAFTMGAMPLGMWFILSKTLRRAGVTTITLSTAPGGNRVIKSVEGEASSVSVDALSEIRVLRGADGQLVRVRLATSSGERLDADNLKDFDGFLVALREAAPACPFKEWAMPAILTRIRWAALVLILGLCAAAIHGNLNPNIFIGTCWFLVLLTWFGFRSYRPVTSQFEHYLLSSLLGERYFWLDFPFAGLVVFLSVAAIVQGMHAVHEGHPSDLFRLSFVPIVIGVPFLITFIRHVMRMEGKRKHLSMGILAAILGANVWFGIRENRRMIQAEVRDKWQVLLDQHRYAEAIPYLEEAYRESPHERLYAERLGYAYAGAGRYQDANSILDKLHPSAGYPKELLAYNNRALAASYVQKRDWPKALGAARVVIALKPDDAEAYHLAGLAAWEIQGPKSKTAHDYYARYIKLEPDPAKTAFIKPLYPDLFRKSK